MPAPLREAPALKARKIVLLAVASTLALSTVQAAGPPDEGGSDLASLDTQLRSSALAGSEEPVSDWSDFLTTARSIGSQIAHPTTGQIFAYGGLAIGAIYLQDRKYGLASEFQEQRSPGTDRLASIGRPLGVAVVPVAAVATYLIGRATGSSGVRKDGLVLCESAFFTFAATEIGQHVFAEKRPGAGGKLHYFRGGGHGVSGHTSIVASMSVPLDRMFLTLRPGDGAGLKTAKVIGKAFAYGLPVLTGWSRMNDNQHFAWNVLLGLGTGWITGEMVMRAHDPHWNGRRETSWSLVPVSNDRGDPGIGIRWTR